MLFEYLVLRGLTLTLIFYLVIKICNPDIKHMFTAVFLKLIRHWIFGIGLRDQIKKLLAVWLPNHGH